MPQLWAAQDWQERERLLPPAPGAPRTPSSHQYGAYGPRQRRRESRRRLLKLAVLSALWLGLLMWPAPQLGAFLTTHLTNPALRLINRSVSTLPGGVETFVSTSGPHQYWQVGLAADSNSRHATGMRATIQTRVPQRVSKDTTDYFWIGSYLADGSFIQLGYYVPGYDNAHAGWFYCSFTASGREGPCTYGPSGSAGTDRSNHTYTLETAPAAAGQKARWRVELDGSQIGAFTWTTGETGTNAPVIYAESSGFDKHDSSNQLGPVDFAGGFAVRGGGSAAYTRPAHAIVMYSAPNVCPPYGIASDGHGGTLLGSGLACPDRFGMLW
jgi:hypothetical protein